MNGHKIKFKSMKKLVIIFITTCIYFILLIPFLLPDNIIYISKGTKSVFNPSFSILGHISILIILTLSVFKIHDIVEKIINKLK